MTSINLSTPLSLDATLACGQAFRWRRDAGGVWHGVIGSLGVALQQPGRDPDSPVYYETWPEPDRWDVIADYFRLDVNLDALYAEWMDAEPTIGEIVERFRGLRVLRQSPRECLFGFLCATCNTVTKIERTVARLAGRYGNALPLPFPASPSSLEQGSREAGYTFPTLQALASADEQALRADLWGYRAPRVPRVAQALIQRGGDDWLLQLRQTPYITAHAELCQLEGIGAKVADCICLFSLDKDDACPIDTHIRQIADRLFPGLTQGKSLTPRVYTTIAQAFRNRFGAYAGWAQQHLFFAELHRSRDFVLC